MSWLSSLIYWRTILAEAFIFVNPIFPKSNKNKEFSRFKHLGVSGSPAHVDGVMAVARRGQIEELTKAISGLEDSLLDLFPDEEKVGNRVE